MDHAALLRTLRLAAGSDGGEEGEGEQGSPGEVVWRGQPGVAPESDGHRHRMEP